MEVVKQFFAIRRLRKTVLALVTTAGLWMLWHMIFPDPRPTSAIGCKNRLAEILWKQKSERDQALAAFGRDAFSLEEEYNKFVTTTTRMCNDQVHFGPSEDGGWQVCLERPFDFRAPCLVYSFGIDNDFRFEKGLEDLLKCEIHAFDPSMNVNSHQYSENGYFHNIGIDNEDSYAVGGLWKMRRLKTIMADLGHTGRSIDYLKMDIEFSEWPSLYDIIKSGLAKNIRQIGVEVHTPEVDIYVRPNHKCTWTKRDTLAAMMRVLYDLRNVGFSMFYSRTNYRTEFTSDLTQRSRYCCHDIHMVNTKHEKHHRRPH